MTKDNKTTHLYSDDGSYEAYMDVFGDTEVAVTIPLDIVSDVDPTLEMRRIPENRVVYEGESIFGVHLFTGTPDALYSLITKLFARGCLSNLESLPSREEFDVLLNTYVEQEVNDG